MSISVKIKSGEDKLFVMDVERLPTKIFLDKSTNDLLFIPFGLVVLVFLFFALNSILSVSVWPIVLTIGAIMAVLSILLWRRRERQDTISFESKRVEVTEAGPLKDTRWEAEYPDFEGVLMRTRVAKSGNSRATYQVIELKHSDPKKTLPLFVDMTRKTPTERWKAYAELFNLPAIREET